MPNPFRLLEHRADIEQALRRVGELLAARGASYAIVIVGGAALNLLGIVARSTRDVDVLAFATRSRTRRAWRLDAPPDPLPEPLAAAIRTVGRDMGLAETWLNTGPALQWRQGLPPGFAQRVRWRRYGALWVGIADRVDLVRLKLYAAADDHPGGRHAQDLIALDPSDAELRAAARWVESQDASPAFGRVVREVVTYVRSRRGAGGNG